MQGGERLRRAICGLLARRLVRRVLLGSPAKNFFHVDIPEALAPAVLRDAALDIVRRLYGELAQAFHPKGTPNVKPTGQHHMCSHKWRVVYKLGTVFLTVSRYCLHHGRHLPCAFVQGFLRPVVGVAHLFDPQGTSCVGMLCCRVGMNQTHGERHTVELFVCFVVRACVLSFCAKSLITF